MKAKPIFWLAATLVWGGGMFRAVGQEGAQVHLEPLQTGPSVPFTPGSTGFRFANEKDAAASGPGYVVFERLQEVPGSFEGWLGSSYRSYNNEGVATGEEGVAFFQGELPAPPANGAASDIIGIMPVTQALGNYAASAVPANPVAATGNLAVRHGRALFDFGGGATANVGFTAVPDQGVVLEPFTLAYQGGTMPVPEMNLRAGAEGVYGALAESSAGAPAFALSFSGLPDSDEDGVADVADGDKLWWETAPLFENNWRATDQYKVRATALGLIFERNWPWVYVPLLGGGKWLYVYDQGDDPERFWAYHQDGYWVWMNLTVGRWYYRWDNKQWVNF